MKWLLKLFRFFWPWSRNNKNEAKHLVKKKPQSIFTESDSKITDVKEEAKKANTATDDFKNSIPTSEKELLKGCSSREKRVKPSYRPSKQSITDKFDITLFLTEKKVGYFPNSKYSESQFRYFPQVYMPSYGTLIKPPVNGRAANKGITEESFCRDFLMKYFTGKVYDSLTVFHGNSPLEPDLTFIDFASGKNIFIDIEIDEPYDGVNRTPTHYLDLNTGKTSDHERNVGFTKRGWIVIRFAEEQIMKTPNACCKFIGDLLKSIINDYSSSCLYVDESLLRVKLWTLQEAREMARKKYREKYLQINEFFSSEYTRNYEIKDSQIGIIVENKLKEHVTQNTQVPPPKIIQKQSSPDEPRLTKKTETPSSPAPQTYGREKYSY
jgi:hypothetical protein